MYAASSSVVKGTILAYNYVVNNVKSTTNAAKSQPVVINGKTYLPVDMVKEGTKVNVSVDSKAKTVTFGEKGVEVPIQKVKPEYDDFHNSKQSEYTMIGSQDFKEVLVRSDKYAGYAKMYFNPDKGYQTLHLEVAVLDEESRVSTFTVFDDDTDEQLNSYRVSSNDGVQSFDTNVAGVKKVRVESYYESLNRAKAEVILPTSYFK